MKKWRDGIEKVVKGAIDAHYWKFFYYYQASDSELTSVAVRLLLVDSQSFPFSLLMIMVNILPYFQIPVSNFLLTIKEFLPWYSVWCGRQDCPRSSDTQPINWFCWACCFICTLDLFKINGFPSKSLNKASGVTKSRGIISISWCEFAC